MFRTLLLSAALAGMAPAADAGDIKIRFGYDSERGFRVGVGLREGYAHRHRHRVRHTTRVWVPGCVERVAYKVWVPARRERVLVPSRYERRRLPCGRYERVLVQRRHYETRIIPGHYVTKYRTVQRPGRWEVRTHVHAGHNHGRRAPRRIHRGRRGIESLHRDRRGDRRNRDGRRGRRSH